MVEPAPPSRRPLPASTVWSVGPNFSISIEGRGVAVLRVWQAPELTREEGAAAAERMARELGELSRTQRGLVLELTRATTTWGPKTQAALEAMLRPWEERGLPVRVVPASEPIQEIAIRALIHAAAPRHGAVAADVASAIAAASTAPR